MRAWWVGPWRLMLMMHALGTLWLRTMAADAHDARPVGPVALRAMAADAHDACRVESCC